MYVNYQTACTPSQLAVVMRHDGPILCIAGPGSGKTRMIVYRAAHLIQSGVEAKHLLITSFTRKASAEIVRRTRNLIGPDAHGIFSGTFHSLALTLLRKHTHALGFESDVTILSQTDATGMIRELREGCPAACLRDKNFPSAAAMNEAFSAIRNACFDMQESLAQQFPLWPDVLFDVWTRYRAHKLSNCVLDYDDILFGFRHVLEAKPKLCEALSESFQYLMIDEFQDTNPIQYDIVLLLTQYHQNVLFVGDDAQSIYAFRGANIANILNVQTMYPNLVTLKLEENHRSTPNIVSLLNTTLDYATEKLHKVLVSVARHTENPEPLMVSTRNTFAQAEYVVTKIGELLKSGTPGHDIAVLYRNSHHANLVDMALTQAKIPFVKYGGVKLTESQHILDVLAFVKILANRFDRASWKRLLMFAPGVGTKTADALLNTMFSDEDNPFFASASNVAPWEILRTYQGRKKYRGDVNQLGKFVARLLAMPEHPARMAAIQDFYLPICREKFPKDSEFRVFGVQQLCEAARNYTDTTTFLDDFVTDAPEEEAVSAEGKVVLSTIHSSKGGEWRHVFVIELVEGALPSYRNLESEEELRLFYVACSRAKVGLYLVAPKEHQTPDGKLVRTTVSRFVQRLATTKFSR
jgi:DNA helicase II / ATP-dependent DNA helicase PcrA